MEIVRKLRAVAVTGGVIALLLGTVAAQASAQPIERAHFHDAGSEVFTDCGIPLLDEWDVMVNIVANAHGPDGLIYFVQSFHGTDTLTNPENGKTFTQVFNNPVKDLKITDNGDGTLTILVQATGGYKVFANGELLFNDPGQVRFELVIDYAGTITDPSDDVEVSFRIVRESTGRNDTEGHDFCTDVLNAIG